MVDIALPLVVAFGLLAAFLVALAQRRMLKKVPLSYPFFPSISILKPLKGIDPDLEGNLRSVFRQKYPAFEVILGTEDPNDPALEVADRISKEFPSVVSTIVRGCVSDLPGFNPKIRNLACLAMHAKHELLLISDSNVRVDEIYLDDLISKRTSAGGGLVWSLFRGVSAPGLGGELESLQLNTAVMGGMCAISLVGIPSALGKSMLLGKADLEAVGGWSFLSRYLAEDHILAEELAKRKIKVTVTPHLVDNILGVGTISRFAARHTRWCRIRIHVNFFGYLFESLLNPVFWSLINLVVGQDLKSLGIVWLAVLAMTTMDSSTEMLLGIRRPTLRMIFLEIVLGLLKGVLWFVPFFSRTTDWRGNRLILGPRTEISLERKS